MWGNVNFITVFLNFLIFPVYLFNKVDLKINLKHTSNKYYLLRTSYLNYLSLMRTITRHFWETEMEPHRLDDASPREQVVYKLGSEPMGIYY